MFSGTERHTTRKPMCGQVVWRLCWELLGQCLNSSQEYQDTSVFIDSQIFNTSFVTWSDRCARRCGVYEVVCVQVSKCPQVNVRGCGTWSAQETRMYPIYSLLHFSPLPWCFSGADPFAPINKFFIIMPHMHLVLGVISSCWFQLYFINHIMHTKY